jgi:hypothetical protein
MHPTRSFTLSCLALVVLIGLSGQAFATTVAVGLCAAPGTHYTTIQAAVNAPSATIVNVCPGTYPEQVIITKSLTLKGIASGTSDAAVVVPPATGLASNGSDIFGNPVAAQIFVQGPAAVTVSNLTVDGTGNNLAGCGAPTLEGIYFQNSSGTITRNAVRNQFQTDFVVYGGCQNGLAINVESLTALDVTISDNSVRAYQKNGITATGAATGPSSVGPAVTISGNYIVGLAATAMNWPGGAGENGVQVGFGASGTVSANTVNDNIWYADTSSQPGNAASGILVFASDGITVSGNSVGSAQFGIAADTDNVGYCSGPSLCGPADHTVITSNKVSGTQIFDAVDLCSSSNTVTSNTIYGSAQSGVHADDSCGSGNGNSVTKNTINEACAGILLGTGSGNTSSLNTFSNVTNTTLAGDVCPPAPGPAASGKSAQHSSLRPSPFTPNRK